MIYYQNMEYFWNAMWKYIQIGLYALIYCDNQM